MPTKKPAKAPTEETIAAYLSENPDFLERHSDLLEKLAPPTRDLGEGVTDFQSFMVERLKGQVQELRETQQALISAGRTNEMTIGRIHGAALRLIEANTLAELGAIIRDELPALCDVDIAMLGLEVDHLPKSITTLPAGMVDVWLGPADAMLRANSTGLLELFGKKTGLSVRSFALMRVEPKDGVNGVIAFASRDPEWFTPDQGTDLIAFLAGIVSRQLAKLLP